MTTKQMLPVPAVTDDACPECEGRGEVEVGPRTRSYWGVWEVDTRTCTTCAGSGTLPDWLLVCETEEPHTFDPTEHYCTHGQTLCPTHVFECGVCAAEDSL